MLSPSSEAWRMPRALGWRKAAPGSSEWRARLAALLEAQAKGLHPYTSAQVAARTYNMGLEHFMRTLQQLQLLAKFGLITQGELASMDHTLSEALRRHKESRK